MPAFGAGRADGKARSRVTAFRAKPRKAASTLRSEFQADRQPCEPREQKENEDSSKSGGNVEVADPRFSFVPNRVIGRRGDVPPSLNPSRTQVTRHVEFQAIVPRIAGEPHDVDDILSKRDLCSPAKRLPEHDFHTYPLRGDREDRNYREKHD